MNGERVVIGKGPHQSMTRRASMVATPALLALCACAAVGAMVALNLRYAIMIVAGSAMLVFLPLLTGPGAFDRAVRLMLVTLPLYSAVVLDLGFTLRISYMFGAAALLIAATRGRLRGTSARELWALLALFLCSVLASIVLNPVSPVVPTLAASGLRGAPGWRPLVQSAQLLLMVGILLVTVSYCRSRQRLRNAADLVVLGGLCAVAYAFYFFIASSSNLPFIDINNAMNTDFSFGYKPQDNSYVGGTIPRPRSTFPEPSNFANYLLLIVPLLLVRLVGSPRPLVRLLLSFVAGATMLLFFFAVNSRGAMLGAVAAATAMIFFARDATDVVAVARRLAAWAGSLALIAALYVELSYKAGVLAFVSYFQSRLGSALSDSSRVGQDWETVWAVISAHPVFGVGFGNLTYYIGEIEGTSLKGVTDAGGLYQRLLAEVGIIGTALYLLFLVMILFRLWRIGLTSPEPQIVGYARALFFAIAADAVQRVSIVGIATDAYLWVAFGLAIALMELANVTQADGSGVTASAEAYATASSTFNVCSPAERQE